MTENELEQYRIENEEKFSQYIAWLLYQMGFSGVGTTSLDIKPDFPMPTDIPENIKNELIETAKTFAQWKWKIWCKTIQGELGEEIPSEWKCPKLG